jgi:hypothetical protein
MGKLKATAAVIGVVLAFFAVTTALGFLIQGQSFILYKYFAPKEEAVRTQIYRQNQSYQDGTVNDLTKLQIEYAGATSPEQKMILADAVIHKSATYTGPMPYELKVFITKIRSERGL